MKYRCARKLRRLGTDFLRGYLWRYAVDRLGDTETTAWQPVARVSMPVLSRPELGEQNEHRHHNIALCCEKIDGLLIPSRHLFSLQRCIGEPLRNRGFKNGPCVVRGQIGEGYGGGICQVSTIIFNTALLANMHIIEKHNHSCDLWGDARMIGLGRDATFVYDRRDLRFENRLAASVLLKIELNTDGRRLDCSLVSYEGGAVPNVTIQQEVAAVPLSGGRGVVTAGEKRSGWRVRTRRHVADSTGQNIVTYDATETYSIPTTHRALTSPHGCEGRGAR
jgi:vancomycin resistance protein VanW